MKHLGLILFTALAFTSCKKDGESGCISQTTAFPTVSAADNTTILALFKNNSLSTNNQVFVSYSTYNTPETPPVMEQFVQAVQVRNNLPIFYSTINYTFSNGANPISNGRIYGGLTLDTKSSLSLSTLRQLFINEAINKQGLNASFKDSCYVAQFGYYNTNMSSLDTTAVFVKAWEVRPKNSQYPQCYISDANSSTLFFDSGLTFLETKR